jgi:hypothetical protein
MRVFTPESFLKRDTHVMVNKAAQPLRIEILSENLQKKQEKLIRR